MKKMFLSLVAILLAATATYAQRNYVATLTHDSAVRTFYGVNALIEAHEAAVDGDVITLSSGKFSGLTVTKCITLRGACMEDYASEGEQTILTSPLIFSMEENQTQPIFVENIAIIDDKHANIQFYNCRNATFKKCLIPIWDIHDNAVRDNINFIQCTGINDASLLNNKGEMRNNEVCDLQGRRVVNPVRGLYVKDGKKLIIK